MSAQPHPGWHAAASGTPISGKKHNKLTISTWNVRTLRDGGERPERRTALVSLELKRYGIDICALQETRFADVGHLKEMDYTFYWSGKSASEKREAGVGFAIRNSINSKLDSLPKAINDRIITLTIPMQKRKVHLVCAYAPTMTNDESVKEEFYHQLKDVLDAIPRCDKLILLGDFNARVGSDKETWYPAIGSWGKGTCNSNSRLLLTMCTEYHLSITNTFFQQPEKWFFSWQHPRSKKYHLLDYIITRDKDIKDVKITRAMRGAEASTDHFLIRSILNVRIEDPRRKKPAQRPKALDVQKLDNPQVQQLLATTLDNKLANLLQADNPNENWNNLSASIYEAASLTLGRPKRRNADWFDSSNERVMQLLEERKNLVAASHGGGRTTRSTAKKLKEIKGTLQRELRKMKNIWWDQKAANIQQLADQGDTRAYYAALKEVYGPTRGTVEPVKSSDGNQVFSDKENILMRWKEHYQQLLNRQGNVAEDALTNIEQMPIMSELDEPPTRQEMTVAINRLGKRKAAGSDGIAAEVLKHGGKQLNDRLFDHFQLCWENGNVPQGFKDATIISIYKNKGDRSQCGNHRGISLLSVAGKVLAKMLLSRLQKVADRVLPESQCGFRSSRSTNDMIFTLRQLQEKSIEQQRPLYICFIDIQKAFDSVDRETLWMIIKRYGCPDRLAEIISTFHTG